MKRIHIPTLGVCEWRRFLADPDTHWKRKASAMELAISWEYAQSTKRGLPAEVARALDNQPALSGAYLLFAFPEHKVDLQSKGKASQNDVWALLLTDNGYLSMTVEAKAGEKFDVTLAKWLSNRSKGRPERLNSLCEILQVTLSPPCDLRYQLFHRTASAVLEAQRCRAPLALMLVQSFREDVQLWNDFEAFCNLLGAKADRGEIMEARRNGSPRLFLGWVDSQVASDAKIAGVV